MSEDDPGRRDLPAVLTCLAERVPPSAVTANTRRDLMIGVHPAHCTSLAHLVRLTSDQPGLSVRVSPSKGRGIGVRRRPALPCARCQQPTLIAMPEIDQAARVPAPGEIVSARQRKYLVEGVIPP